GPPRRRDVQRGRRHLRHLHPAVRVWCPGHADHDLRNLGRRLAQDADLWQRRRPERAGSQRVRRPHPGQARRGRGRMARRTAGLWPYGRVRELPRPRRERDGSGAREGPLAARVRGDRVSRSRRDPVHLRVSGGEATRGCGEHVRAAHPSAGRHNHGPKGPMIGAELYTLREHLREPEAIAAGLNRVRTLGYEGVELAGLGPIEPARLATILQNTGLVACSAHVAWERLREDRDAAVEDCQTLGFTHMALPCLPRASRDASGYARLGLEAGEVAARLQEAGIRLSYHNHSFELERFGAENGLEILYRSSDPSLVRAQIDTYWIQYGGGNPAAWIRRLTGRLPSVHLKDMAVSGGAAGLAEIGRSEPA